MAGEFFKLYPVTYDGDVIQMEKTATRDQSRVSIDVWSANQVKLSGKVYTYFFDRPEPWPEHPEFQAFHTSEVPYVFETLAKIERPWEPIDHQVADTVSSYWINFATSGDPNGKAVANWPAYNADQHATMELGAKMGPMPVAATPERLKFQRAYLDQAAR